MCDVYLGMKGGIKVSGTSGRAFPWAPPPWELDREVLLNLWSHIKETLLGVFEELGVVGRHRRMSGSDSGQSGEGASWKDGEEIGLAFLYK